MDAPGSQKREKIDQSGQIGRGDPFSAFRAVSTGQIPEKITFVDGLFYI
jgi:hypothetical protein